MTMKGRYSSRHPIARVLSDDSHGGCKLSSRSTDKNAEILFGTPKLFVKQEFSQRHLNFLRTDHDKMFISREMRKLPPVMKTKVRVHRNLGRVTDSQRFRSNISVNDLDRVEWSVLMVSPSREGAESASHVSMESQFRVCTPVVNWTMNCLKLNSEGWCDQ